MDLGVDFGSSGSAASMLNPAITQVAGQELAATTWGIASGVRNRPR